MSSALGSLGKQGRVLFSEHHMTHAASAFYPSPFERAAILTIDGVGEWATTSLGSGDGKTVRLLYEINYPHSLGLLYSALTYYCGFKVNSGRRSRHQHRKDVSTVRRRGGACRRFMACTAKPRWLP